MPNWKSKLFVRLKTKDGNVNSLLTPIQDIQPTFNLPKTALHSTEADNVGVARSNQTYTFNLTVLALKDELTGTNPSEVLTSLGLSELPFDIVMVERKTQASNGNDWGFEKIQLEDCYVTNANPSRITYNGAPAAVFNCMCLGVTIDDTFFNGTNVEG